MAYDKRPDQVHDGGYQPGVIPVQFHHGQFLGSYQKRRELFGVSIAEMTPTVPEHEVETHTHDDAHFLLLLDGLYVSSAHGMPDICTETAIIMNPPGTRHRDCFRGTQGRFLTLSLSGDDWRSATKDFPISDVALRLDATALLSAYRIWRELHHWDDASALAVEAESHTLFSEAGVANKQYENPAPAWLSRTRELLRDASFETPRFSELAKTADLHPVYFARAFRHRYGCSPGEYLRRCRLERATGLLRDKRLSLVSIAMQCGFVDQSHFNHSFRRTYRVSPGEFRSMTHSEAMVHCVQDARQPIC
ncbi:MAG: helix-turn-helix transcriptional regulator [Arenimonas sp.]